MYWKMWKRYGEKPFVVEADNMDEAFKKARELDDGYCSAQPMDEKETRLHEASKPKVPPANVMAKMAEAYRECDWDKLDWLCKVAEQSDYDTEGLEEKLFNLQRTL